MQAVAPSLHRRAASYLAPALFSGLSASILHRLRPPPPPPRFGPGGAESGTPDSSRERTTAGKRGPRNRAQAPGTGGSLASRGWSLPCACWGRGLLSPGRAARRAPPDGLMLDFGASPLPAMQGCRAPCRLTARRRLRPPMNTSRALGPGWAWGPHYLPAAPEHPSPLPSRPLPCPAPGPGQEFPVSSSTCVCPRLSHHGEGRRGCGGFTSWGHRNPASPASSGSPAAANSRASSRPPPPPHGPAAPLPLGPPPAELLPDGWSWPCSGCLHVHPRKSVTVTPAHQPRPRPTSCPNTGLAAAWGDGLGGGAAQAP